MQPNPDIRLRLLEGIDESTARMGNVARSMLDTVRRSKEIVRQSRQLIAEADQMLARHWSAFRREQDGARGTPDSANPAFAADRRPG